MANVEKLVDTSCALAWEATDMQSFLRQSTASQDFILASFSMHHLESQEAKLEVLQESRRLLAPCKGKLLMVDVIRWPAESIQGKACAALQNVAAFMDGRRGFHSSSLYDLGPPGCDRVAKLFGHSSALLCSL